MILDDTLKSMAKDFKLLIERSVSIYASDDRVIFKHNFDKFNACYVEQYKYILNEYMKKKEDSLDRHKVAAIIILSVIEAGFLETKSSDPKFTGNYALAVDVALNYMLDEVNEILTQQGQKTLEGFLFPEATTCKTEYYKIFYRNLYYIDKNDKWKLNPLDIADRLFLIEYIMLLKRGIDPNIIKWK